jgi:SMODS and SLOG-associating 2TM effector domain family 5
MSNMLNWLLSLAPREKACLNETERLEASMKTTAVSRYKAAERLGSQGKFTFYATTLMSLASILIPLMQLADVQLAFSDRVLNAIQIFFAVAVLVYSVVIGTAHYELRSDQLNNCGDKIKELIRELRREKEAGRGQVSKEQLAEIQARYSSVSTDVENHNRNDHRLAVLQLPELYPITGIIRLSKWGLYHWGVLFQLLPSVLLLAGLSGFILEVFGITNGLSRLFK